MSAALDLLVTSHESGIRLQVVSGEDLEYEGPEDLVTDEVLADLRERKAELLRLLEWNEERAYALIRKALAYLAGRYADGSDLTALGAWENRMNASYAGEDMGSLRVAVRGFVRAGLASFAGGADA